MFTDVEASTRRWERYGDAMRDALRRHDAILREEIEGREGYVFKTIGDAFCAAFPAASRALEAAIAVQRRLAGEDFSTVDGLFVRMAINAGQTDERDGDYFGPAVNLTARLMTAAHGGQILISGMAADLLLPYLPNGVVLRHLGSLPLKDIQAPERVYQPIAQGLRSDFKPLRALETPPNNLPRQSTSFVGRHEDLARVEALLDEGPLLTIVGAGGIGKTRLALEVAAARLNDERDGAWFVDLSSIATAGLIPATILAAVGGERSPDGEALDDLLDFLEKRQMLLVLDNSEHLVSEVAALVAQIILRCTELTVLATSRSPLDISGERIYRLSSLDSASAVQLFGDRARAANSAFVLDKKLAAVQQICRRLDGIALAIELAAARVRTMSIESLASHLELRLLTGGRDRRPRQQTMRALIDWSYDLLSDDERMALRRASVFARGFTLATAAAVCSLDNDEWKILDLLTSLAEKSLLVVDVQGDDQRYRFLEPIREYAYEKLVEIGELSATLCRHASALASLARDAYEEWDRGPQPSWLTRFEAELPNLRNALRWAFDEANDKMLGAAIVADTAVLFLRLGFLDEGTEYCQRVLGARLGLAPSLEGRLRYGLSMLYSNLGADKKCLEAAIAAVSCYREAGDERGLARALSQVSSRYALQSRYAQAKEAANEALHLARESDDRRLLADVLRRCATTFASDGPEIVRSMFAQSVRLFRALGRGDDTWRALTWSAQWEMTVSNYAEAAAQLLEAATVDERDSAMMFTAGDIANCYLALGDWQRAAPFVRQSLGLGAKLRHSVVIATAVMQLALMASKNDPKCAARLTGYAEERFRAVGYEPSAPEDGFVRRLHESFRDALELAELDRLLKEGATWSDDQAVAHAFSATP